MASNKENISHDAHLPDFKSFLKYDYTKSQFKWTGTSENLKKFVISYVYGETNGSFDASEDPAHKLVTFKLKNLIVKFYLSTQTLLIQGTKQQQFKDTLLKILSENSNESDALLISETDQPENLLEVPLGIFAFERHVVGRATNNRPPTKDNQDPT